jgi:hypothetical protein
MGAAENRIDIRVSVDISSATAALGRIAAALGRIANETQSTPGDVSIPKCGDRYRVTRPPHCTTDDGRLVPLHTPMVGDEVEVLDGPDGMGNIEVILTKNRDEDLRTPYFVRLADLEQPP